MKKIYAIRDSKGEYFNNPFFNNTHGEAERNFDKLVNDKQSNINQYPEDYSVYHLGDFDESKGTIIALKEPQLIVNATQLRKDS